ncbi:DUF4071 domain-containing protein [Chlorobaculum sp. 24CR]|uniref:TRAFs-binding domain-containing protein n=1 Tax=Chlorobaculum sp. 24CR TaxID=2508878 RepID=UPI00100AEB40|nr:TRAFs-binding domain-containing protein [Chlorobaculum sp. 24CR]RXK89235.1 DUF4071 domain-containing protein [Chlorobaculum sp. 24CR]
MNQHKPLCFVIMPFGTKPDPVGGPDIDFDRIYNIAIRPAIEEADMEPIRADEERVGGIIHEAMFERLLLCDYAIADLTTANANVFYELGVRHTALPRTTLTIFAQHQRIPFDVNFLRSLPYALGENNGLDDKQALALRNAVSAKLRDLRRLNASQAPIDSPLFKLLSDWNPGQIAHDKTDTFRNRVQLNETMKQRLTVIREQYKQESTRKEAQESLQAFREEIEPIDAADNATLADMMLTYRALKDWNGMIDLYEAMPLILKKQIMVREQLGFAYNRRAGENKSPTDRAEALRILTDVDKQQGPSPETLGLIGRIHKDNWEEAIKADKLTLARGHLNKAIDAYRRGYLADQRDAYPGINLLTLLDIRGDAESLKEKSRLLPVVRFAVERRLAGTTPNYWDHATMLELSVLKTDEQQARNYLAETVAIIRETWEPETTARNLKMIEKARQERGEETAWLRKIIDELDNHSK